VIGIGKLFEEFLGKGKSEGYLWVVDPSVVFDGDWKDVYEAFWRCHADLLATNLRTPEEDPKWTWWSTLKDQTGSRIDRDGIAAQTSNPVSKRGNIYMFIPKADFLK
jgi:hypothetical protein